MTTKKPRVRMVISVTYQPRAECIANIAGEGQPEKPCPWTHDRSPFTVQAAKDHAAWTGHSVQVFRETVSEYERDDA